MKRIIYDFGANNGDDIPYYLMKSDLVVAVEANPELCNQIRNRFSPELEQGKLVVENAVLTDTEDHARVPFYIHKKCHLLSQFPKPKKEKLEGFVEVELPSISPASLILKHGTPHYIKIDIEHFDAQILRCLFQNNIRPDFISAESHCPEVFSLLVALGGYEAFKLVEGWTVSKNYKRRLIRIMNGGTREHSFPYHSAGPFGGDIDGEWVNAACLLRKLGIYGCGWRDIHAAKDAKPESKFSLMSELKDYLIMNIHKKRKQGWFR